MGAKKLELTLIPVSKKLTAKGGYRGHIADRVGLETAKCQLHRSRAYFDTWLAKYPEYRGDFSRVVWGNI